jgi:hypothetical protein
VTEDERDRLFQASAAALSRATPELNPNVRRRVLAAYESAGRASAVKAPYRWALGGFALAALVAAAVVLLVWRAPSAPSFQVAGRTGPIGQWLTAEASKPLPLRFSEGTQVSLGEGSRGRVTRVTPGGAHIELASGTVDAEITHLPGADWSFGAGPFDVLVTGTHLDVSWSPATGKFELSVSRGSVVVKGPFIEGPQAVRAGQVCRVDLQRHSMELAQLDPHHPPQAPPASPVPPAANASVQPSVAEPVAPPAGSSANVSRGVSAESLLEEARAARLAGRPEVERAALLACRKRAPGQAAAAQAAYLLGRASVGAEAAVWFETYLREQPQGLLAREAAGRLIESYRAAGNASAAQAAASRYLGRYPNGPHASLARRALTPRSESQD